MAEDTTLADECWLLLAVSLPAELLLVNWCDCDVLPDVGVCLCTAGLS